jgi:hypothetical protein
VTRYTVGAAVGIAVLWLLGVAHATELVSLPAFDLDKEGTIPQAYSGLLLLVGAAFAYLLYRGGAAPRRAFLAMAVVLGYMSVDEVFRIHEEIDAALNFDWQILYLPIVAVAFAGWLGVERLTRDDVRLRVAWWGAAGLWVVAQVLEAFQWKGVVRPGSINGLTLSAAEVQRKLHEPAYLWKMLPEELFELVGALLFAVVLAALARRLRVISPRRSALESARR